MANTNIQGVINLNGPGFVAKKDGNYRPGEFKRLHNAELWDGVVRQRRNIHATGEYLGISASISNPEHFIGNLGSTSLVVSKTEQRAISWDSDFTLWSPTSLPVDASSGSFHKITGFIEYNAKYYWTTHEYKSDTKTHTYSVYHSSATKGTGTLFSDLTRVVFTTKVDTATPATPRHFRMHSIFLFKDRLWFAVGDTLYFSKATDPTVITVPDGGFFRIPDQRINQAFPHRDSVYLLTNNSIYSMSYSYDVNEDGYLRPLTQVMGAEWGVVHESTPYVVNRRGVYVINGTGVDKVIDTDKFDRADNVYNSKLVSFDKYLIVIRRERAAYHTTPGNHEGWHWDLSQKYWWNTDAYNVFFVNTDNGATHTVDIWDQMDNYPTDQPGIIIDAITNPTPDNDGNTWVYFLTNVKRSGSYNFKGFTYGMNTQTNTDVFDEVRTGAGAVERKRPRYDVEISSYVPDGNEYMWQKFRTALVMGIFPETGLQIQFALDNQPYRTALNLSDADRNRPHNPHRFPLNQRGHALSVQIFSDSVVLPTGKYESWQLSDLRVLWSYTGRASERRSIPEW